MTTQYRSRGAFALLLALMLPLGNILSAEPTAASGGAVGPVGEPSQSRLERLSLNDKLRHSDGVLDDFRAGDLETRVIVRLRSPDEADALADLSRWSIDAGVPELLQRAGKRPFFNLKDAEIRERLRRSVTKKVGAFVARMRAPGVAITQRFAYQSGLAAKVTAEGLERLLQDPEVLLVEPDRLLEAHTDQGISLMDGIQPSTDYDGSGLSIAICDTGIDTSHPMLGGGGFPIFNAKVIGGYDTGDGDNDPRPNGEAHGTACAGIAEIGRAHV